KLQATSELEIEPEEQHGVDGDEDEPRAPLRTTADRQWKSETSGLLELRIGARVFEFEVHCGLDRDLAPSAIAATRLGRSVEQSRAGVSPPLHAARERQLPVLLAESVGSCGAVRSSVQEYRCTPQCQRSPRRDQSGVSSITRSMSSSATSTSMGGTSPNFIIDGKVIR